MTVAVETVSLRIGHLLYGEKWHPTTPHRETRPAVDILTGTGGIGPLTHGLHRLLTAAQHLAEAAPHQLAQIKNHLVTDSPEHRPTGLNRRTRWYPIPARQLDTLTNTFHTTAKAQTQAAAVILTTVHLTGTDTPRARLDTAAHHLFRPGPPD
ncbi:hypothetical protein ACSNOC_27905, partial [Streptomyces sp. URMC 129]